jgi:PilZ domain
VSADADSLMLEIRKRNSLAGVTPMGRDRRVCPRYTFTAEAEALDEHSRARMSARTSDISRGGCYVDTFCPFPRNTNVRLRIRRDKESLVAQARVVYSKLGMGMGLSFTALEAENRQILEAWIGELSGAMPPELHDVLRFEPEPRQDAVKHLAKNDPSYVVGELIIALMRRGSLTTSEGNALLLKLVKRDALP